MTKEKRKRAGKVACMIGVYGMITTMKIQETKIQDVT